MRFLSAAALMCLCLGLSAGRSWADDAPVSPAPMAASCSEIADEGRLQVWRCVGSPGPECLARPSADAAAATQTYVCVVAH